LIYPQEHSLKLGKKMGIREYLFEDQPGKNGRVLPFTRFDTVLSAILALALMVAMAYAVPPQTALIKRKLMIVMGSVLAIWIVAQHRRAVFGVGFGIVAFRFLIAMLIGDHLLFFLGGFLLCSAITWFLLRNFG
jgi:hypothetical protein